jgi:hypothetical protein
METIDSGEGGGPSRSGVGTAVRLLAAVATAALVLAGVAALARGGLGGGTPANPLDVAAASTADEERDESDEGPRERPRLHGHRGWHGFGFGKFAGGPLHGEFVVPDTDGEGYRTVLTQRGEVTAVSSDRLSVRSDDGFTQTYRLTDATVTLGGTEGVGDLAEGDDVHVSGVRTGDGVRAVHVADIGRLGELRRDRFRERGDAA